MRDVSAGRQGRGELRSPAEPQTISITEISAVLPTPSRFPLPGWRQGAAGVCNGKISITHKNVTRAEITFCRDRFEEAFHELRKQFVRKQNS